MTSEPHREQAAAHLATVEQGSGLIDVEERFPMEVNLRLAQIHAILHVGEKLDELTRILRLCSK